MVPRAENVSRVPRARARRAAGYSSTIIVTPIAYSAPRNTRLANWKKANDQMSQLTAVSAVNTV